MFPFLQPSEGRRPLPGVPARSLTVVALMVWLFLHGLAASAARAAPAGKKWSLEPPVTVDFDMENIPEPKERERSYYYDALYSTFGLQIKEGLDFPGSFRKLAGKPTEAYNVNVVGEVPDSSWYTSRNTRQRMSLEAIRRGPNRGNGPAAGPWTVIQGKTEGITPGFLIRDSAGDIYQLKFDPPEYPEMATAAEMIASRLYHAAGYNVKENYIVTFTPDRLLLDPKASMRDQYGKKRAMSREDLEEILSRIARQPDGFYRAVAGKYLDGVAKGPFSLEGVRQDDPNDWIPHQDRRDLRGLRVFCSWVNENDFREGNTLDMYVEEEGRHFLRHYVIDLGSSLGSDTTHPNIDRIGNEYMLDFGELAKSLFSLGLYRRPWKESSKNPPYPSVGFLESEIFDPGRWKPNYPVLPFEKMTLEDAFWGARLVVSFSEEQIRTAVESGEFSDPEAVRFLTQVLVERRDKIGRYWLERVNPLHRFEVERDLNGEPRLNFQDLEIELGYLEAGERTYEYELTRQKDQKGGTVRRISVWSLRRGRRQGGRIDVYVFDRQGDSKFQIVGVDRNEG